MTEKYTLSSQILDLAPNFKPPEQSRATNPTKNKKNQNVRTNESRRVPVDGVRYLKSRRRDHPSVRVVNSPRQREHSTKNTEVNQFFLRNRKKINK